MVDITPGVALLAALQNQFAAARQGQPRGNALGIPGLTGGVEGESPSLVNALSGGGITGGGVPSTATTGSSVANALAAGLPSADPLAQQVALSLGGLGGFGGGQPERPQVGGGDAEALLSILGGPMAIPTMLASLVFSDAAGLPPNPSLFTTPGLAGLASGGSGAGGGEVGGIIGSGGSFFPGQDRTVAPGSITGADVVGNIRGGFGGGGRERPETRTGREAVNRVRAGR